jgi:hypothetical protein
MTMKKMTTKKKIRSKEEEDDAWIVSCNLSTKCKITLVDESEL